jgi:hypothetical protein
MPFHPLEYLTSNIRLLKHLKNSKYQIITNVFLTISVVRTIQACLHLHANAIVKKAIVKHNFNGNVDY